MPGIVRLRYTTSHPRDMDDALIAAHRDLPAVMPYLHLPVQSGSDRILDVMNRKHTGDEYRRLIERIRHVQPDLALSSDFIVGFPGETDADFEETMRLVADVGFACSFSFKYSPRPGTPAAEIGAQVPEAVKAERLARLQKLLEMQSGRLSITEPSGRLSTFSWRSRVGIRARWLASRPICSRCSFRATVMPSARS